MYSINQIGEIASGLLSYEFDYIIDEQAQSSELLTISGTLSGKIGELNTLINQNFYFTGADGNPYPRLGYEEKSILSDIYLRDHYTKQSSKTLRGIYDPSISGAISGSGNDWIELREGDTTIKRSATTMANSASNRISLSKEFKALAIEAQDRIKDLIYAYNMYGSKPRQVAGIDAPDLSLSGNHTT